MQSFKRLGRKFCLFAAAVFLAGCATVNVPVPVTHSAEINMSPYKQIAISRI